MKSFSEPKGWGPLERFLDMAPIKEWNLTPNLVQFLYGIEYQKELTRPPKRDIKGMPVFRAISKVSKNEFGKSKLKK